MLINILLPYKEKFSKNKASSVSLTVANNLQFSKYKKQIRVFGHNLKDPMYKDNFVGIDNSWNFLKSNIKKFSLTNNLFLLIIGGAAHRPKKRWSIHNYVNLIKLLNQKNQISQKA